MGSNHRPGAYETPALDQAELHRHAEPPARAGRGAADVNRRPADTIAAMEFELEEGPSGTACERCGRLCEPLEMGTCPVCKRGFCLYCAHRVASRNYCSRACGEFFFFGGGDEQEEGAEDE